MDTAYGNGTGVVTLSNWTNWTAITGMVVQPSGKIDLAVQTAAGGMSVAQLNSDGSADSSFGTGGLKTLGTLPAAQGIVIAANGDLLVAGVSSVSFTVAALNHSDGSLDTGYNTSGTATIVIATTYASALVFSGMAVAPNGDLILGGTYTYHSTGLNGVMGYPFALAALTAQGAADSGFGTSGVAHTSLTNPNFGPGISPIAVTAGGKILVGQAAYQFGSFDEDGGSDPGGAILSVTEFNANGSMNSSFGSYGTASVFVPGPSTGRVLNIISSSQIVIGAGGSGGNFILVRFNADGSLDTAFGSSGIETGAGITAGLAMVTASNGETIMIGTPSSGSGIILQEFYSLTRTQTLYVEQDANYNVTSLTDVAGNVAERYVYDPYGTVTVLNADGSVRGSGTLASSSYGSMYTFQGGRTDPASGLVHFQYRDLNTGLGRWIEQDPAGYVNGPNVYQLELSNSTTFVDPTGLSAAVAVGFWEALGLGAGEGAADGSIAGPGGAAIGAAAAGVATVGTYVYTQNVIAAAAITNAAANAPSRTAAQAALQAAAVTGDIAAAKAKADADAKAKADAEAKAKAKAAAKPKPTDTAPSRPQKEPGQQLDEIRKAQDAAKQQRPHINDDENDDWDGAKTRPKMNRIRSIKKSYDRDDPNR